MKKTFITVILYCFIFQIKAQSPQAIPYQAIVRNASGNIISNQAVKLRFSIHDSLTTGAIVYKEIHTISTNAQGLVNVNIGKGSVQTGTFSTINWGKNGKFIQTELDALNNNTYTDLGTTQMMSVPYALYAEKAGTAQGSLPSVSTLASSSVSFTSATLQGVLNNNGGEQVLLRGFYFDTISFQTINSFLSSGVSNGNFSLTVTGLIPGKRYYVRAFATNSNGTAIGDTSSFITSALSLSNITTDSVNNITNAGATVFGNITNNGGSVVTSRGFCYGTTSLPTTNNLTVLSGNGSGSFNAVVTGLSTNSTYYVRSFATNSIGTSYGQQIIFTTVSLSAPTITTDSVTAISYTTAISGISILNNGGSAITSQGVCWSTTANPTTINSKFNTALDAGHYTVNITGLISNTTYYLRAFSTNSIGTTYGNQYAFITLTNTLPIITTNNVISISTTTATSGGNITSDGGATVTARGVCWGGSQLPTKDSAHTNDGTGTGIYNSNITGLLPSTTYFVRAYATNSLGTVYGTVYSFTTASTLPSVLGLPTVGTSQITYVAGNTSALTGGYVNTDGGSSVIARGVCWGTLTNPTLANSFTTDGIGLGYFVSTINNLTGCSTTYNVRSYATNSTGTAYGNQYSVVYVAAPANVVTLPASSITINSAILNGRVDSDGGCAITERGLCWGINANPSITNSHTISGIGLGVFNISLTGLSSNITYHYRAYAKNNSGTYYGPDLTFTTLTPSVHYIGEPFAGGIIFHLDSTGNHGYVVSDIDNGTAQWGCNGRSISGTSLEIGTAAQNTSNIVAGCSTSSIAAKICSDLVLNGYSDWSLPSKNELLLIYQNLKTIGVGGFQNGTYWSITEYSINFAWMVYFSGGTAGYTDMNYSNKTTPFLVRSIRTF